VEEGANAVVVDGRDRRLLAGENGFFLGGCLFDHAKPGMSIYDEEIFSNT
jgi:malonate-semialdehyde dehydrogenase (acetylating)/methylmalonate-semialdehyde dehydrogenase